MDAGIMAGEPQCDRVGMPANNRGLALVKPPGRFRQARLAADKPRPLRSKIDFKIAFAGDRLEANSDRALERLGRSFFRRALGFDVRRHALLPLPLLRGEGWGEGR